MGGSMNGQPRTIVLLGRTGSGKSATGNSIIGKSVFKSRISSGGGVTRTAESHSTTLLNGRVVNVIDTPGFFEFSVGTEFISEEIMKCVDFAKDDGVHAVLLVFSVRSRFSEEEEAAIKTLWTFLGPKLTPYMIVIFTGGDALEEDESLEDYLISAPDPLQKVLQDCKNRVVLFDNRTKDEKKKAMQCQELRTLVDKVIEDNGGHPYMDSLFSEFREAAMLQRQKEEASASNGKMDQELTLLDEHHKKPYEGQLELMMQMAECEQLKGTNHILQQQLAEERAARLKAEENSEEAYRRLMDVRLLRQKIARADEIARNNRCAFL